MTAARVDTIHLDAQSAMWLRLASDLENWHQRWSEWLWQAPSADHDGGEVSARVRRAIGQMDAHARALESTSRLYDEAERDMTRVLAGMTEVCAWFFGRGAAVALLLAAPAGASAFVGFTIRKIFESALPDATRAQLSRWQGQLQTRIVSHPATVATLEAAVGVIDEGVMGALGIPLPVAFVAGSRGVTSVAGTSRLISRVAAIAAHPEAALAESAGSGPSVRSEVKNVSIEQSSPPQDFADILSRIPTDTNHGGQVRIERYGSTAVVYIGGTVDSSFTSSTEPWDMASNVAALGGDASASENAVREAMHLAGVQPSDSVILAGHSQGGLVAMRVAESLPASSSVTVITAGAPIHQIEPQPGTVVVAFEHRDDIVPALGGPKTTAGTIYVDRLALAGGTATNGTATNVNATAGLPAHRLVEYVTTASLADEENDVRLRRAREAIAALSGTGSATMWRATRLGAGAE